MRGEWCVCSNPKARSSWGCGQAIAPPVTGQQKLSVPKTSLIFSGPSISFIFFAGGKFVVLLWVGEWVRRGWPAPPPPPPGP